MRALIQDPVYWQIEEDHFSTVNITVFDHHLRSDPSIRMAELSTCPPVSVLRKLWLAGYKETLQQKALVNGQHEYHPVPKPRSPTLQQLSTKEQPELSLRRSKRLAYSQFRKRRAAAREEQRDMVGTDVSPNSSLRAARGRKAAKTSFSNVHARPLGVVKRKKRH
jgi:hypothetical protein